MDLMPICRKAAKLSAQIKELETELEALEEKIMAAGPADYGVCRVIVPRPQMKVDQAKVDQIRTALGEHAELLLETVSTVRLVKSAQDIAKAVLPAQVFAELLSLTEVQGPPQIRYA